MSLPARKLEPIEYDTNKKEFESSIEQIADQARLIDQKMTMTIEKEISQGFENRQKKVNETKFFVKKMSSLSKNDTV
ncbi:hypothetical protein KFZ58_09540 [Virgibacillus sp. NKC19-16]|uniref:hypothetical protein n=1 Tax=Virgibacillus salidurans TaxID=2831673 RepID=UPI001F411EA4|nr:hypothetical protein [Virgibacillus sp. NKC19-16]UJL48065.1 hypothetical protein KFZ58_09540 [Virgibacillus sp. NKC19-16]